MTQRTTSNAHSASLAPAALSDLADARLVLLEDLEASLHDSQRALLGRDIDALMALSRKQELLARASVALSDREHLPSDSVAAAAARILQLGRIQIALLGRAQNSLRIIKNLLTGAESDYSSAVPRRISGTDSDKKTEAGC